MEQYSEEVGCIFHLNSPELYKFIGSPMQVQVKKITIEEKQILHWDQWTLYFTKWEIRDSVWLSRVIMVEIFCSSAKPAADGNQYAPLYVLCLFVCLFHWFGLILHFRSQIHLYYNCWCIIVFYKPSDDFSVLMNKKLMLHFFKNKISLSHEAKKLKIQKTGSVEIS